MSMKRARQAEANPSTRRERRLDLIALVGVALVAVLLGGYLLGFLRNGITTPSSYGGDTLLTGTSMKGIIDNGQSYVNPYLAAPGTGELFDFPGADGFFLAEIWVLSLFTSDFAVLLNLFVWLTYPLIAVAALWSMRRLGFSRVPAFVFAVLYACIPFHQSRVTGHQSLSAYFVVPLAITVIAVVVLDLGKDAKPRSPRRYLGLPIWAWLVVLLIGTCGIYYAYFSVVLAFIAGVVAAWTKRDVRAFRPALAMIVATIAIAGLQFLPSYIFWSQQGGNNLADTRHPAAADLFALRLTQLVYPATGHRFAPLAAAKENLRQSYGLISPMLLSIAYDSSLGFIGVFGLFLLFFWALTGSFRAPPESGESIPAKLSLLGISSFLLATVGGVGGLIAFLGFPQIRAYDRITPFIAFLSLCAAMWALSALGRWLATKRESSELTKQVVAGVVLLGVLLFGLWDQTNSTTIPRYDEIRPQFESDRAFVQQAEELLPEGAMVFQLPYIGFPESAPIVGTTAYDPLRMYLHSRSLHWSAGAFMGRSDAQWQERVAKETPERMVDTLRQDGFAAVVIDRNGYDDAAAGLEEAIAPLAEGKPVDSPDGRFVLYMIGQ
jgi:phosphoglycerol transferase